MEAWGEESQVRVWSIGYKGALELVLAVGKIRTLGSLQRTG